MANLFSDNFEDGTANAWGGGNALDSGDLSVTAGAKLHGTYGLNCLINDITSMYLRSSIYASQTTYHASFLINTNSLAMTNGDSFEILALYKTGVKVLSLGLKYVTGSDYDLYCFTTDDNAGSIYIDPGAHTFINGIHCVEVYWKAATAPGANNGIAQFWVDGTSQGSNTTINSDTLVIEYILFGAMGKDAGTTGTFFLDDFYSYNDDSPVAGTYSSRWSGLEMVVFSTVTTTDFDGYVDNLLANGITNLRVDIPDFQNASWVAQSKAAVGRAIAKGANVIWGVSSNSGNHAEYQITAANWPINVSGTIDSTADTTHFIDAALTGADNYVKGCYFYNVTKGYGSVISAFTAATDTATLSIATSMTAGDSYTIKGFHQSILDAATWAQANGVFEIQLGNEEESHNDNTTLTNAQLQANILTTATEVQAIFTRGNVSYTASSLDTPDWITLGKGDLDILAMNVYRGGTEFIASWPTAQTYITNVINAFGPTGTYITEFNISSVDIRYYSQDEVVQAVGVNTMLDYIRASGMTRATFFYYISDTYGARYANGTYRELWFALLGLSLGKRRPLIATSLSRTASATRLASGTRSASGVRTAV